MSKLHFKPGPHGHAYATTHDGMEIVRCQSGNTTFCFYKKSRPEIDNQRVRMHYEELVKYNLHIQEHPYRAYSLDQHGNIHWGDEVRKLIGRDKDGFPLYVMESDEIYGAGVLDGKPRGFKSIWMPDN